MEVETYWLNQEDWVAVPKNTNLDELPEELSDVVSENDPAKTLDLSLDESKDASRVGMDTEEVKEGIEEDGYYIGSFKVTFEESTGPR